MDTCLQPPSFIHAISLSSLAYLLFSYSLSIVHYGNNFALIDLARSDNGLNGPEDPATRLYRVRWPICMVFRLHRCKSMKAPLAYPDELYLSEVASDLPKGERERAEWLACRETWRPLPRPQAYLETRTVHLGMVSNKSSADAIRAMGAGCQSYSNSTGIEANKFSVWVKDLAPTGSNSPVAGHASTIARRRWNRLHSPSATFEVRRPKGAFSPRFA